MCGSARNGFKHIYAHMIYVKRYRPFETRFYVISGKLFGRYITRRKSLLLSSLSLPPFFPFFFFAAIKKISSCHLLLMLVLILASLKYPIEMGLLFSFLSTAERLASYTCGAFMCIV